MCPPIHSPLSEIGSSDEQIIFSLDEYICGSTLPCNVIADLNPYQCSPSDLPVRIWYLIHSNENKEFAFGFWKAKGETHEIYLNSELSGWKTTLEFFEGQAPNGRRTGWLSQEYRITQKGLCHKTEQKDYKSLCRIFLPSSHSPKNEIQSKDKNIAVSENCIGSVASVDPNTNNNSGHDSSSKSGVKKVNSFPDDFAELECFSRGDFLELDDLAEPESLSSSSENSSCPSRASDEYFDSFAVLWDLNYEHNKQLQGKDSSKYRFSASVRPDKVLMKPTTLGSIQSGSGSKLAVEGFLTGSIHDPRLSFPDKQSQEHANGRKDEHRIEGTSNFFGAAKPSATQKDVLAGERKDVGGRMKRLREIICFRNS